MARLTAIFLLAWALLLGPALCIGGLLEHTCDCGSEIQCQHEDSCSEDPCSSIARLEERGTHTKLQCGMPPIQAARFTPTAQMISPAWSSPPPPPPERRKLPYEESDRPLRI